MASATSLWADTAEPLPAFPKLAGEVKADVVIIGAGYTGLSAAHHIARSGLSPVAFDVVTVARPCTHRSAGRTVAGVRYAPNSDPIPRRSEMTRYANRKS